MLTINSLSGFTRCITTTLLLALLCSCSHTIPNQLVISNQSRSNYAANYGSLPLEIKLYSTTSRPPTLANKFYQTWNTANSLGIKHTLLVHTTIGAGSTSTLALQIPKSEPYLTFMAHFYDPSNKHWYASVERPHNLAWVYNYLQASISQHGVKLAFTQHSLGGL